MTIEFPIGAASEPRVSSPDAVPDPALIIYAVAEAAIRLAVKALMALHADAPGLVPGLAESAVRGIYGAVAALGVQLPVIHLTTEAE